MAENRKRLHILLGQDAKIGVGFQRASQIDEVRTRLGDERGIGQARTDGLGYIERGGTFRELFNAAVGQLDVDVVRHILWVVVSLMEGLEGVKHAYRQNFKTTRARAPAPHELNLKRYRAFVRPVPARGRRAGPWSAACIP